MRRGRFAAGLPPVRRGRFGRFFAGLSPVSASPLDDDLARPWRSWWGVSLCGRRPRVSGERNRLRRVARYAFWGRAFYYFSGHGWKARTRASRVVSAR